MVHTADLSENMTVRARGGEALGTIIRLDERSILVERGFSLRDYSVPIELASEVVDGDVYLTLTADEVRAGAGSKFAARTLSDESRQFVHEGPALGASDNLPEGGTS
jgi:hypothetical protein